MILKSSKLRKLARLTPLLIITVVALIIYGCNKPGVVGNNLVPANGSVAIDTIPLTNYKTSSIDLYSGDRTYYSAGIYNDKLFGKVVATGLVQPQLVQPTSTDTIKPDTKIYLRFYIRSVYGDTNKSVTFDIQEASKRWRGKSWTVGSTPPESGNVITSFTVGNQDSVDVQMPQSWVQKYRSLLYDTTDAVARDSIYNIKEPGFVIVPKTSGKIVSFLGDSTNVLIGDTLTVSPNTWAYSVNRTNEPDVGDSLSQVYSTFSRIPSADFNVTSDSTVTINGVQIKTKALSRVELTLYEDSTLMKSSLPSGNVRPKVSQISIYYLRNGEINFDVLKGPIGAAVRNKDGSYRINFTSRINDLMLGASNNGRYYFVPQTNNGIIYSLLLRTPKSVKNKPKLIITSVKQ